MTEHSHDDHKEGFSFDLPAMQEKGMVKKAFNRRGLLTLIGGGAAAVSLAACSSADTSSTSNSNGFPTGGPPSGAPGGMGEVSQEGLEEGDIPEETAGPYPGDGSNGVNVLTESGIIREDITKSFGSASAVAAGVPLAINLNVYNHENGKLTPYEGAAVYLWHCDRDGNYSLYSSGVENENYLRGVQEADKDGLVKFTSIFPACYSGRWPHIHFEVYDSIADATSASNKVRTTQIALPEDACKEVYNNAEGYTTSITNLSQVSLTTDNVFSDGHSLELATLTGSIEEGYSLALAVPV